MSRGKDKKIHYAWFILLACCIMQFGGLGILMNSISIFIPAVKENLGFTTAQYSTYIMFQQFAQAFMLPISGRIISKARTNISILLASIGVILANASLVLLTEPWQWNIAGAFKGVFGAFLFMTLAPMVLKRWFKKKTGFAVGLASAFSGIGGAIISPIGISLIEKRGWQFAMMTLSVIAAISLIPTVLFILKLRPEYVGLEPYGAEDMEEETTSNESVEVDNGGFRLDLVFFLVVSISVMLSFVVGLNGHTLQIATSLGLTTIAASFVVSATMFGNIFLKLLIGWIGERFSSFIALATIMIMVVLGLLGYLLVGGNSFVVMLISGFLYGGCMSLNAVGLPVLVGDFYSGSRYDMVLSYAMMFSMTVIGICMALFGVFYDRYNTYLPLMIVGIGVYLIMIFAMGMLYRRKNISSEQSNLQ